MIKRALTVLLLATVLSGCKKDGQMMDESKDNAAFPSYTNHFLEALWKLDPDRGTLNGYHQYDSLLIIPNDANRKKLLNFARVQADSLEHYNVTALSDSYKIDYQLIQNETQRIEWSIQSLKDYEWDPTNYNVIGTFAYILNERYAPLDKRLLNFYEKMASLPAYYKEAQKQIKNPVPELTELAASQINGSIGIFEKDYANSLKKSKIPEATQKLMLERARLSAETSKAFASWLDVAKSTKQRSFRLGQQLYQDKFKYQIQSVLTPQQIYNAAVDRKKFLHQQMAKLSRQLWPQYFGKQPMPKDSIAFISRMVDTLSAQHVKPAGFQTAIEQQLPKLVDFVKSKNLLTLDQSKPLIVRKEPAYMAGVAGASLSAPGPYDKNGNSYFNVASLAGWPAERADSYLREYNKYTLQILCIHEAIPGHYTQSVYANKAPSLVKAILSNTAMIEGWAVYAEEMMLDAGYGSNSPEMRLMWYKWNLRSVCNTILDYSVHTGGMTKEQAIKMLTHEAFQQQAEAENKWKRVTVSSVQLDSYFTGYKEICDLRDAYRNQMGDKFSVKEFNEKFLSYGNAPVKYIKEMMMTKTLKK